MTGREIATLATSVALLGTNGCSHAATPGPVYPPVETTMGNAVALGADTAYVVDEPSFRLVASSRATLRAVDPVLGDVSLRIQRLVGSTPPRIAIAIADSTREAAIRAVLDSSPTLRALTIPPMPARSDRPEDESEFVGVSRVFRSRLAREGAQTWMSAYADACACTPPAPASPTTANPDARTRPQPLDARDSLPPPRNSRFPTRASRLDPRIPAWLQVGLIGLAADAMAEVTANSALQRAPGGVVPLDSLLRWQLPDSLATAWLFRPTMPTTGGPPVRDRGGMQNGRPSVNRRPGTGVGPTFGDRSGSLAAQSISFVQFLTDRFGRGTLGQIMPLVIGGRSLTDALATTVRTSTSTDALDHDWHAWLDAHDPYQRHPGGRSPPRSSSPYSLIPIP